MNLIQPINPIFAHSENIIYVSGVDQFLDCSFEIKTAGTIKPFFNTVMAYNGNCEINLGEILKMFYYKLEQSLPAMYEQEINGDNELNGGELKITLKDFSDNTEILNYNIINGALQKGESFNDTDQILNQVAVQFYGFPSDHTKYVAATKKIVRIPYSEFLVLVKCKGIYLAWMNKYGAFDYYLFDGVPEMDINSSSLDEFKGYSLGKKSNRQLKIRAKVNEDIENYSVQKVDVQTTAKKITEGLMSIIESPEVYVFYQKKMTVHKGGAFDSEAFDSGFLIDESFDMEGAFVKLKEIKGNNKLNYKSQVTEIEFDITLPDEYNITAI
ncbi:hypothetical protein [Epilithonimonas sp. UC225_85]|uniref:hypothetical protein n=1 Tax=Epilithonimonas sp. UC225_85 TaxID=3350167 RepID=UPI0036D36624